MSLRMTKTTWLIWAMVTLACFALSTATNANPKAPTACTTATAKTFSCGYGLVDWSTNSVTVR